MPTIPRKRWWTSKRLRRTNWASRRNCQLGTMYPVYIRGQAQLMAHNGAAAATEFQKFLDHRGITLNFPLGALAHLGLARAYALARRHRESEDRLQ